MHAWPRRPDWELLVPMHFVCWIWCPLVAPPILLMKRVEHPSHPQLAVSIRTSRKCFWNKRMSLPILQLKTRQRFSHGMRNVGIKQQCEVSQDTQTADSTSQPILPTRRASEDQHVGSAKQPPESRDLVPQSKGAKDQYPSHQFITLIRLRALPKRSTELHTHDKLLTGYTLMLSVFHYRIAKLRSQFILSSSHSCLYYSFSFSLVIYKLFIIILLYFLLLLLQEPIVQYLYNVSFS
ncbi:hypothetical protein HOY80DRAFT_1099875, partial [Tuber brumale]